MSNDDVLNEISRKLDILIRLVATQIGDNLSVAERAPLLSRAGVDRNAIADVCNTTAAAVSVRLAEAKRGKTTGRRGK